MRGKCRAMAVARHVPACEPACLPVSCAAPYRGRCLEDPSTPHASNRELDTVVPQHLAGFGRLAQALFQPGS